MIFLGKELGKDKYPFIVAEISCNHEGDLNQAKQLIQAAKDCGANAVKIQVYTPDDMTIKSGQTDFRIEQGPWNGNTLYELYSKTQTDLVTAEFMISVAEEIGIPLFASIFSYSTAHLLTPLPAYKIASFEITDTDLIRRVAKLGKPMVISAGLANLSDVDQAMLCVNQDNAILLHCVSAYPTKIEHCNLWKINEYKKYYGCPIGFSDHTRGLFAGPLAVAMGAVMLEKHLALPNTSTEDSTFSLHPAEFEQYVNRCQAAASAAFKVDVPEEEYSRQFRRSIYVVKDVHKGDLLTWDNIRAIRPSYGYPAQHLHSITTSGLHFTIDLKAGTALKQEHFK